MGLSIEAKLNKSLSVIDEARYQGAPAEELQELWANAEALFRASRENELSPYVLIGYCRTGYRVFGPGKLLKARAIAEESMARASSATTDPDQRGVLSVYAHLIQLLDRPSGEGLADFARFVANAYADELFETAHFALAELGTVIEVWSRSKTLTPSEVNAAIDSMNIIGRSEGKATWATVEKRSIEAAKVVARQLRKTLEADL